jgi:hypothetical protein
MRTTRPPVVDWLSLALQAASSDTSTSTTATIQASYAIAPDFFNGLLGRGDDLRIEGIPNGRQIRFKADFWRVSFGRRSTSG